MSETYLPTLVVPHIAKHTLGRLEIDCVTVKLTPEEWKICDEVSGQRWSNSKGGAYGKGIINSDEDKHRAERIGTIGEMAFSKISGLPVDLEYRKGGDDYDFICNIGTIDVKNASKLSNYKQMLIYGATASGKEIDIKSDFFVGSFLAFEDRLLKKATVVIVGWCDKQQALSGGLKRAKAKKCGHYNYEVHFRDLRPISELLEMINPELETVTIKPEEDTDG